MSVPSYLHTHTHYTQCSSVIPSTIYLVQNHNGIFYVLAGPNLLSLRIHCKLLKLFNPTYGNRFWCGLNYYSTYYLVFTNVTIHEG